MKKFLLTSLFLILSTIISLGATSRAVIGPATDTTANSIPRWTDTTAFKIKGSSVTINDAGAISGLTEITLNNNAVMSVTNGNSIILTTNGTILSIHGAGSGVTLVVASSTSAIKGNYTCDGSADQTEINAALSALPATGGTVLLTDGTFTLTDFITIPSNARLIISTGTKITTGNSYSPTSKTLNSVTVKPLITNSDHSNGNTNIYIGGPGWITLIGTTQSDTTSFSGIWFQKVTNSIVEYVRVSHILEGISQVGGSLGTQRYYGIFLSESSDNLITKNRIHFTGDDAINIGRTSYRNIIKENIIYDSGFGHGVQITGGAALIFGGDPSVGNIVEGNIISTNRLTFNQNGVVIHGGIDNIIKGNRITISGGGIALAGNTQRTIIIGNLMTDIYANGFLFYGDASGTAAGLSGTIIGNNLVQINSTGTNAIHIHSASYPSTNIVIKGNLFFGSNSDHQNGIYITAVSSDLSDIPIEGNFFSGFGQAAILTDTANNTSDILRLFVQDNDIYECGAGIYIVNSGASLVRNGKVSDNYIQSSRNFGATATGSAGVILADAQGFTVTDNRTMVAGRGFGESGTSNTNRFENNDATGSGITIVALAGAQSTSLETSPFTLQNGAINQPFTSLYAATNAWFILEQISATLGGSRLQGISDGDSTGLSIRGGIGAEDPDDATVAVGITGFKRSGTTKTALGSSETVATINNDTTLLTRTLGDGSTLFKGGISAPSLDITNSVLLRNITPSRLAVFSSDSYLTNGTLAESDIVTATSSTVFSSKTMSTVNNTIIQFKYQDFLIPSLADGTGAVFNNTTTARSYRHATFAGNQETNVNFVEYIWAVPNDIDTSQSMQATLKVYTSGTDTDAFEFRIKMINVSDSGGAGSTSFINIVQINSGTLTSPAAGDVFTKIVTLTDWNTSVTASDLLIIRLERLDNANDDSLTELLLRIGYFSTQ